MGEKIINLGDYNKPKRLKKFLASANGVCYTGLAAAFLLGESDVVLVAANIDELKKQYEKLTDTEFDGKANHIAIFPFKNIRGRQCK